MCKTISYSHLIIEFIQSFCNMRKQCCSNAWEFSGLLHVRCNDLDAVIKIVNTDKILYILDHFVTYSEKVRASVWCRIYTTMENVFHAWTNCDFQRKAACLCCFIKLVGSLTKRKGGNSPLGSIIFLAVTTPSHPKSQSHGNILSRRIVLYKNTKPNYLTNSSSLANVLGGNTTSRIVV